MNFSAPIFDNIYPFRHNPEKALEALKEGLALRESAHQKRGISISLGNLGFYYLRQGNAEEALKAAQRAYEIDKEGGSLDDLWYLLTLKGHAYNRLGQASRARRVFAEAVEVIETLRLQAAGDATNQQNFMRKKISPYHRLIGLLAQENDLEKALYYAERSKAGLLLSILQSGKVNITKAMSDAEKAQERVLKDEVASLTNQLEGKRLRLKPDDARLVKLQEQVKQSLAARQTFLAGLYGRHPELQVQRGQTPAFNLTQAGHLLTDPQTALLEYAVTADQVYLFVLTKAARQTIPTLKAYLLPGSASEIGQAARNFRELLATHNLVFRPAATQLYELLIKPAQAELRGKTKLVIVPDQTLWELPFQALQTGDGRYLIEHYAISYAPRAESGSKGLSQGKRRWGSRPGKFPFAAAGDRSRSWSAQRAVRQPAQQNLYGRKCQRGAFEKRSRKLPHPAQLCRGDCLSRLPPASAPQISATLQPQKPAPVLSYASTRFCFVGERGRRMAGGFRALAPSNSARSFAGSSPCEIARRGANLSQDPPAARYDRQHRFAGIDLFLLTGLPPSSSLPPLWINPQSGLQKSGITCRLMIKASPKFWGRKDNRLSTCVRLRGCALPDAPRNADFEMMKFIRRIKNISLESASLLTEVDLPAVKPNGSSHG